jgi:uncharacterized protein YbjT (DUF2867 family)
VLRILREARGLSPEALSEQIAASGAGSVSGKTIRRIEDDPWPVPTLRVQKLVAGFFDRHHYEVWQPQAVTPDLMSILREATKGMVA